MPWHATCVAMFIIAWHDDCMSIRLDMTPVERILARCKRDGECLIWTGARWTRGGNPLDSYGHISIDGKTRRVHKVIYESRYGQIDLGMTIDHVKARGCVSKLCCNIDHLECVTNGENTRRGDNPCAKNARKTHCPRGHVLAGDNLVPSQLKYGYRQCAICARAYIRRKP